MDAPSEQARQPEHEVHLGFLAIVYEHEPYRVVRHLEDHPNTHNFYPMFLWEERWHYFQVQTNPFEHINFVEKSAAIAFVTPVSADFLAEWKDAGHMFLITCETFRQSILASEQP
jgi:hypothetical protein